jgi:hypothetical protein
MLSALAFAVAGGTAATIQGVVRAEGSLEPIPLATVTIHELRRTVQTDAHGFFVLSSVPAGRWRVEAAALGYRGHALTIVASESGVVRLDFELPRQPVQLPGVLVRSDDPGAVESVAARDAGPAAMRLRAQSLKTVPGLAEPDLLRALQMLPAVAAMSDYSSALYVRGGSPEQNLMLLDGVPLFNPYHVGGLFSALPTDAVSTVDLWAGAVPARLGDRVSSVVAINTRDGGRDQVRTAGGIGVLSTSATVDGPLNGRRGSFLASGRRTYLDAVTGAGHRLGLLQFRVPYGFSDAYLKATHDVGELGSLSLSGYWNGERLSLPEKQRDEFGGWGAFGWGSRLATLSYRQPMRGSLLLQARVGYTDFRGDFDGWGISQFGFAACDGNPCDDTLLSADTTHLVLAHARASDVIGGADVTWFRGAHTLRAGVQLDRYRFDNALTTAHDADPDFFPPFALRSALTTAAAYAEDEWQATPRLHVRGGVRVLDAGALGRAWLPRAGVRWQVLPTLALTAGAGRYAQALRTMKDDESAVASFIAYDLLMTQPADAGLVRGSDVVAGIEYADASTRVRAELFRKTMDGVVVAAVPDDPMRAPPLIIDEYRVGSGTARGLELSARRLAGRFEIGGAYALSAADRRVGEERFTPRFERRHQLDVSGDYRWGERGLVGARLVLGSGQPYTPVVDVANTMAFDPVSQQWVPSGPRLVLGDHNSGRLPGYTRLDVAFRRSYDRSWFGRAGTLTPYAQIVNVLNNRNALLADAQPYEQSIGYLPQFPILPTFGVEWRF